MNIAQPVDVPNLPQLVDPENPPPAGTFVRSVAHGDFGMLANDFTTPENPGVYVQWLDGHWSEIDGEQLFVAPVGTQFQIEADFRGWRIVSPFQFTMKDL